MFPILFYFSYVGLSTLCGGPSIPSKALPDPLPIENSGNYFMHEALFTGFTEQPPSSPISEIPRQPPNPGYITIGEANKMSHLQQRGVKLQGDHRYLSATIPQHDLISDDDADKTITPLDELVSFWVMNRNRVHFITQQNSCTIYSRSVITKINLW